MGPEPERAEPEPEPEPEAPVGEWQVLMCGDLALTASKAAQGATLHMKPKLEGAEAKAQVSNGITAGMLQRWRLGEHGHIQTMAGPEGSQCCIDIDGKNPAEGARVHLWNAHMPNPAFPPATQQVRRPLCTAHASLTGAVSARRCGCTQARDAWSRRCTGRSCRSRARWRRAPRLRPPTGRASQSRSGGSARRTRGSGSSDVKMHVR